MRTGDFCDVHDRPLKAMHYSVRRCKLFHLYFLPRSHVQSIHQAHQECRKPTQQRRLPAFSFSLSLSHTHTHLFASSNGRVRRKFVDLQSQPPAWKSNFRWSSKRTRFSFLSSHFVEYTPVTSYGPPYGHSSSPSSFRSPSLPIAPPMTEQDVANVQQQTRDVRLEYLLTLHRNVIASPRGIQPECRSDDGSTRRTRCSTVQHWTTSKDQARVK